MRSRHGFVLLTVLWIIIGVGTISIAVGREANSALFAAQAGHDRMAGRWLAEGCVARARAVVDEALATASLHTTGVWQNLDSQLVTHANTLIGCDLSLVPDGRIVLSRATDTELRALPGMTPESIARILQARDIGIAIPTLRDIEAMLSNDARATFMANYQALSQRMTVDPDAWVLRSRAHLGKPPTPVNIEVRLVRSNGHAGLTTVTRWVEW